MQVQPYLFFNGNCEEVLAFYKAQLGAEIVFLARYKDAPDPGMAAVGDKVMHSTFTVGESTIMAADAPDGSAQSMQGAALSIGLNDVDKGQRLFDALASGGTIQLPFQKTFWARGFGMLVDRFGVRWMVNCE